MLWPIGNIDQSKEIGQLSEIHCNVAIARGFDDIQTKIDLSRHQSMRYLLHEMDLQLARRPTASGISLQFKSPFIQEFGE